MPGRKAPWILVAVAQLFVVSVGCASVVQQGLFPNHIYELKGLPFASAAADVNADGRADLIVGEDWWKSGAALLLATTTGSFSDPIHMKMGPHIKQVVARDLNHDGWLDLVGFGGQILDVRLGGPHGFSGARRELMLDDVMRSMELGDLDSDGLDEAVLSSVKRDELVIASHSGDGCFRPTARIPVSGPPTALAVADFDQDGNLDVATVKRYSKDLSVLMGRGNLTFKAEKNVAYRAGKASDRSTPMLAVGDWNDDGIPDLAVKDTARLYSLIGRGDGNFVRIEERPDPSYPVPIWTGNLDDDGDTDMAVVSYGQGYVSFLSSQGDGTFHALDRMGVCSGPTTVAIEDFSGDGIPDLAATCRNHTTSVHVFLGRKGDGLRFGTPVYRADRYIGGAPIVGDVDRDGLADVVARTESGVALWQGTPQGQLRLSNQLELGFGPTALALGDFNGDGAQDIAAAKAVLRHDYDIFVIDHDKGFLTVLLGDGQGEFQTPKEYELGRYTNYLNAIDLNSDGALDIVVGSSEQDGIAVLPGNEKGEFGDKLELKEITPSFVATGDFNEDGRVDIVAPAGRLQPGGRLMYFSGMDGFHFGPPVLLPEGNQGRFGDLGDLNGDDHLDIVTSGMAFLGRGDGTFLAVTAPEGKAPRLGDFDGDERQDLALLDRSGSLLVSIGHGDGTFDDPMRFAFPGIARNMEVEDLNQDGRDDVIGGLREGLAVMHSTGNASKPGVPALLATNPLQAQLAATLDEHHSRWKAHAAEGTYRYRLERTGPSPSSSTSAFWERWRSLDAGLGPVIVEVREHRVASVVKASVVKEDWSFPIDRNRHRQYNVTIDDLFGLVKRLIAEEWWKLTVNYDPLGGYPVRIMFDSDPCNDDFAEIHIALLPSQKADP